MKITKQLLFLFAIIIFVSLTGCSSSEKHPGGYDEIAALIGQPKETVVAQLALPDDLQEVIPGMYEISEKAEYAGIPFDVCLSFDVSENSELFKIRYTASYENNPEQASDDILTVAKALSKAHGKTYVREETVISEIKKKTLVDKFSGEASFEENNFWDLTPSAEDNIKQYIETVGASESWKAVYGKLNYEPYYYLDCDIGYIPGEKTAYIILEYSVDAYRGDGNYTETDKGVVS